MFGFEGGFIVDPKTTTEGGRSFVYLVIAHELAHQWFGDFVTMKWWDDTWLNEGFASWLQVKASDHFHPEWKPWLDAQQSRDGAMQLDVGAHSHPVITPVQDPARMDEDFDQITYDKGQAVISMLEAWLGEARFRKAISDYVGAHGYGSATSDDLWRVLQAVDPDAAAVAQAFTERAGVPLLQASVGACRGGMRPVRVTQARLTEAGAVPAEPWPTPLRLAEPGAARGPFQVVKASAELQAQGCGPVLVNAGQAAYARVAYDDGAFAELLPVLGRLEAIDQMGLVEDQWALARAGMVGADRSLQLMDAMPASVDQHVWDDELTILRRLDEAYEPGPDRDRFRAFARRQLGRVAAGASDVRLKHQVAGALARYDDPAALAAARADLERLISGQPVDPDARSAALNIGVPHADAALFDRLAAWARQAGTGDKAAMLDALGNVQDPALADRALALTLSDDTPNSVTQQMLLNLAQRHGPVVKAFLDAHAEAFSHRLRDIDLKELEGAVKPRQSTAEQQRLRAQTDAWLAARAAG